MSISSAPAATASSVSRSFTSSDAWPDGNAVDTDAAFTPVPSSASFATPTSDGYTHTAATDGISGIVGAGQTAFAHRCRTLPGRVGALERGEVDHRHGEANALLLGGRLDGALAERRGALLDAHAVHVWKPADHPLSMAEVRIDIIAAQWHVRP